MPVPQLWSRIERRYPVLRNKTNGRPRDTASSDWQKSAPPSHAPSDYVNRRGETLRIMGMVLGVPVVTAVQKTAGILLEHRRGNTEIGIRGDSTATS